MIMKREKLWYGIMCMLSVWILTAVKINGASSAENVKKVYAAQELISEEKACNIALKDAKTKKSKVSELKVKLDDGNEYEIRFIKGDFRYEYEINAYTGKIKDSDIDRVKLSESNADKDIGEKKALKIALKNAGISKADLNKKEIKKKKSKKHFVYYDIELKTSDKEYEYDIDAYTGKILEKDVDTIKKSSGVARNYDDDDDDEEDDDD